MSMELSHADVRELQALHAERGEEILARLESFRAVPRSRYFYELCYCLMTPQSSATQCYAVAEELERRDFLRAPFDPSTLLRSFKDGYVRFHNTKARRLLHARDSFGDVLAILDGTATDKDARNVLATNVHGLGMKEASHFLRNIGRLNLTIIDRHILRNLVRLGALEEWPASISRARYLDIEARFEALAVKCGIPVPELDLLLWSRETGGILK